MTFPIIGPSKLFIYLFHIGPLLQTKQTTINIHTKERKKANKEKVMYGSEKKRQHLCHREPELPGSCNSPRTKQDLSTNIRNRVVLIRSEEERSIIYN